MQFRTGGAGVIPRGNFRPSDKVATASALSLTAEDAITKANFAEINRRGLAPRQSVLVWPAGSALPTSEGRISGFSQDGKVRLNQAERTGTIQRYYSPLHLYPKTSPRPGMCRVLQPEGLRVTVVSVCPTKRTCEVRGRDGQVYDGVAWTRLIPVR